MIVSVHIPKTAGTSFRHALEHRFGPRLLADYGDWPESASHEAVAHRERSRAEALAGAQIIGERYDVIHGHFAAGKYAGVFPDTRLVTMVRDPYQHAVSTFEHASRLTASEHPDFPHFVETGMTLVDLIEAFPDHQSRYVGDVSVDEFAMIGLTERYERSVALFEAVFGVTMPRTSVRHLVNPKKDTAEYAISHDVRRAVERSRAADVELYRRAYERFARLCSHYGV